MTLAPGEWVAVLGAGGGVGLAATDLATSMGAGSSRARRRRRSSTSRPGPGPRRPSTTPIPRSTSSRDPRAHGRRCRRGVDPVGGPRVAQVLRALRFDGRYVVVGFASGEIPDVPLNHVLLNDRTVIGIDWDLWAGADRPSACRAARRALRPRDRSAAFAPPNRPRTRSRTPPPRSTISSSDGSRARSCWRRTR